MFVVRERIHRGFATGSTHADRRDLVVKVQPFLGQERGAGQFLPGAINIVFGFHDVLAFAVVAETAGLEDQWEPDRIHGRMQVVERINRTVARQGNLQLVEQALLGEPVLRRAQCFGWRKDRDAPGDPEQGLDGHVLELVGDDVAGPGEFVERRRIVERAVDYLTRIGCRWRIGRIDIVTRDTHAAPCKAEHLAELPGAYNADTHGRRYCRGSGLARTASVWFRRY